MRTSHAVPFLVAIAAVFSLAASFCAAGSSPPDKAVAALEHPALFDQVQEYRLDNGMLFLLLPRHDVPMVSGFITVRVGNVDNPAGATGLAHMFEHMAFKGTDRIGTRDAAAEKTVRDSIAVVGAALTDLLRAGTAADTARVTHLRREISRLGEREQGLLVPDEFLRTYDQYTYDFNAYTNQDFTAYHATLPANNLEVWMLMESERLQHPVFRGFYPELEVVREERRTRTDDNPDGLAAELLKSLAFSEHPYRYPTIGYMADLQTLNPNQIEAFWREYYTPGNMVAALVGDFQPEAAKAMITDYFGDIPAGPSPAGPTGEEPPQTAMRRGTVTKGAERKLLLAFPGFAPDDPRLPAAGLLSSILSADRTSRLDRRLDLQEGVSRSVHTSSTGGYRRYRGLFTITVALMGNATNEQAEDLVWQELDRLQTDPVDQAKLDEIRSADRKGFVFGLQKNKDIARLLATTQAARGNWRWAYKRFSESARVTPAAVTELARELFTRHKATVVYLEPEPPAAATEGAKP